jgi:NAD(P)-dependent dehydrogenase (short-subunit alcohol dehydrogenase family)
MARLEGKVAIITGGGSGLGRAMAQRFVAEGASVLVADVNDAGGQETLDAIDDAERTAFQHVDVTNEDDCERVVAEAARRWGKLDIMVANAGIGAPGPIATLDKAAWDAVIAVNLTGVFLCAKHAFRAMRDQGGVILGTASVAGLEGTPALGPYGASKAGVVQLMGTVALEGARYGIRANALCPVWTQTPMVDAFVAGSRAPDDEARARLISGIPLGRLGDPSDVASAAVYLASDEASFITGVAFRIDGGHLAGR